MKNLLYVSLIGLIVSSCNQSTSEDGKALTSGLYLENMDTTVAPGDNFQMYVNGKWIRETEIPSDKSSYGVMYMLHEKSQENVKAIIEEAASGDFEEGSDEQKIGALYSSYLDTVARNATGSQPLQAEFDMIDAITDKGGLADYFAYASKYDWGMPINLFVYPNMKDPNYYALYNWQGGLGLPDREYYFKTDARSKQIREAYLDHVATMFELVGLENGEQYSKVIMDLETRIAENHWKKEDTRDMVRLFNYWKVDSVDALMPNFDLKRYLTAVGVDQEKIVITQPSFTLALDQIISSTDMDTWKTYLKWKIIDENASRLSMDLDRQNFKFYQTELKGVPDQLPMWRRAVNTVNANLGEVVGKVYVKKHFPPEAKSKMEELVNNLLKAYEVSIKELDWMGEETKKEALDKLSKFTPKIGYPDKWKDYSAVEVSPDDLFNNLKSASEAEHQRQLEKLKGPVDRTEWGMTPQTVNAYYNPPMNEIVFPAAILQPPYFDMNADAAVNYGSIGAVIGHEIGHGFDDKGSTFDGDGVLRNWWTDSDREEFEKRTKKLIEQYNSFEVIDSVFVNGEFTQGENIGDLGGLTIGLKAYKMSLEGKEAPVMDGFTGVQRVFLGWGQVWMLKAREEALRMQVATDPHSPALFRVNGIVRNVPEFYEAFNVKEGDSLYLAPEDRVKIW